MIRVEDLDVFKLARLNDGDDEFHTEGLRMRDAGGRKRSSKAGTNILVE